MEKMSVHSLIYLYIFNLENRHEYFKSDHPYIRCHNICYMVRCMGDNCQLSQ